MTNPKPVWVKAFKQLREYYDLDAVPIHVRDFAPGLDGVLAYVPSAGGKIIIEKRTRDTLVDHNLWTPETVAGILLHEYAHYRTMDRDGGHGEVWAAELTKYGVSPAERITETSYAPELYLWAQQNIKL